MIHGATERRRLRNEEKDEDYSDIKEDEVKDDEKEEEEDEDQEEVGEEEEEEEEEKRGYNCKRGFIGGWRNKRDNKGRMTLEKYTSVRQRMTQHVIHESIS